jgi:4-amino-4-deoxy-L-arabinose transferase-like glycosyltransferase
MSTVLPARVFWTTFALLLALAVGHTLWATSLDSFTIDEPYHIAAGASYLRWGDYRVNPEHPPLVKLVAALAEPAWLLHLDKPKIVNDKYEERIYTQTAVYLKSNSGWVQFRARLALITFNTLLLGVLILLLKRVFSGAVALATLLLLALDPTVCAHMPVVMTDLPMALLGTISCCLAVLAVRQRRWKDWVGLGLACGLLMATKHSAPLILLPLGVGCVGVLLYQGFRKEKGDTGQQLLRLVVASVLCVGVLWSTYGFRFHESRDRDAQGHFVETFNRPLDLKISDLQSPVFRNSLTFAEHAHLLPRAYLWGLADTLRAGVEGRPMLIIAFKHEYYDKAPAWVAFAFLIVKLPLGFLCLAIGGVVLLGLRLFETGTSRPLAVFLAMFAVFMAFIAKNGIFYAGLRHWLFSVPLLAIAAAACVVYCLRDTRVWVKALPVVAIVWIAVTVLPQRRIWEYHNALAGARRTPGWASKTRALTLGSGAMR